MHLWRADQTRRLAGRSSAGRLLKEWTVERPIDRRQWTANQGIWTSSRETQADGPLTVVVPPVASSR